jgi:hypothetical protein
MSKRRKLIQLALAAIALVVLTSLIAVPGPALAAPANPWRIAQLNSDAQPNHVNTIAFTRSGQGWAGGVRSGGSGTGTVIQRLTDQGWRDAPVPSGTFGSVKVLAARTDDDVWAFGRWGASRAAHWNGKRWSRPTEFSVEFDTTDAVAVSGADVWAVSSTTAYAWHWTRTDGWRKVTLPANASGVAALSPRDVWAGGGSGSYSDDGAYQYRPAIMHWNGKAWRQVRLPAIDLKPDEDAAVNDIVTLSRNDIWAVGSVSWLCGDERLCYRPLTYHYDGHKWRLKVSRQTSSAGYDQATGDGGGGLWIAHGSRMVHVADGVTTTHELPKRANDWPPSIFGIANRGTTAWTVGSLTDQSVGSPTGVYYRAR